MRRGAIEQAHPVTVYASLVAAEASHAGAGFRQRDVRFFIELFSNWIRATHGEHSFPVHNAQTQRLLDRLVREGRAKRVPRSSPPVYRLTGLGLVESLSQLVNPPRLGPMEEFFLVLHLVRTYGSRLRAMVKGGEPISSAPVRVDIDQLLHVGRLIRRQTERVDLELEKLALRIEEAKATQALSAKLFAAGRSLEEVTLAVQRKYPYELNSHKPLGELIAALPPAWGRMELEEASGQRADQIWGPTHALLAAYREILDGLS